MWRRARLAERLGFGHLPYWVPGTRIVVQCHPEFLGPIAAGEVDFFEMLGALAAERGCGTWLLRQTPALRARAQTGQPLSLLIGAPSTPGARVLHVCPTYIRGFWYVDPIGERHESSIRTAVFDPAAVNAAAAKRLASRLRGRLLANNRSKYPQAERGQVPVPEGCIALFAQEFPPGATDQRHFEMEAFLHLVIRHRGARPVVIKPHPLQTPERRARIEAMADPLAGVHVLDASLHDILSVASVSASLTSAAAFEGFLHGTPAILGGETDFHHNALTVRSEAELAAALAEVDSRRFAHERFLHWFLRGQCLAPWHDDFSDRLLTRIAATGFTL